MIEESTFRRQIRENIEGIFWRLLFWRIHGGRENSENIHLAKITHYTVIYTFSNVLSINSSCILNEGTFFFGSR